MIYDMICFYTISHIETRLNITNTTTLIFSDTEIPDPMQILFEPSSTVHTPSFHLALTTHGDSLQLSDIARWSPTKEFSALQLSR